MISTRDIAFDEIAARFDDQPGCEGSARCTRPARWRINLHGCEQAIMCTHHKSAWVRQQRAEVGMPRCVHCGTEFDCAEDAFTVAAI